MGMDTIETWVKVTRSAVPWRKVMLVLYICEKKDV